MVFTFKMLKCAPDGQARVLRCDSNKAAVEKSRRRGPGVSHPDDWALPGTKSPIYLKHYETFFVFISLCI